MHGEIRYLQIPAADPAVSADFYAGVFGWRVRTGPDGGRAFEDPSGHVNGTWVLDRESTGAVGVLVWIRVSRVETTLERIADASGEIISPIAPQSEGEAIATFRDPAGNVLGIFHEGLSRE